MDIILRDLVTSDSVEAHFVKTLFSFPFSFLSSNSQFSSPEKTRIVSIHYQNPVLKYLIGLILCAKPKTNDFSCKGLGICDFQKSHYFVFQSRFRYLNMVYQLKRSWHLHQFRSLQLK